MHMTLVRPSSFPCSDNRNISKDNVISPKAISFEPYSVARSCDCTRKMERLKPFMKNMLSGDVTGMARLSTERTPPPTSSLERLSATAVASP